MTMDEYEYIESIDASFPYEDEKEWQAVIDHGISISDNAAYMALYEICGAPSERGKQDILKTLRYWSSKYSHPTKKIVLECALAVINDSPLSKEKTLYYLDIIEEYPGLYNAIGVIHDAGPEDDEEIDAKCNEIYKKWKEKS